MGSAASGISADYLEVKEKIFAAFTTATYPGDTNLRNSDEGEEPFLLEQEFRGKDDWRTLSPEFIDQAPDGFASALSFFSPEAFRFYLPAYLIADLDNKLQHSDPIFNLTHGLTDPTKDVPINLSRYGDLTWFEYMSERFSAFMSEEVQAIVSYLQYKRRNSIFDFQKDIITQALSNFWNNFS